MHFVSIQGFDVMPGKMGAVQEWLTKHEPKMREAAPEGCEYMGTFVAVHTSEKKAGSLFTLWRLDSYGAQDALAAAGKEPGKFRELTNEFFNFIDIQGDNWSDIMLKSVVDATMFAGM